MGEVYTGVWEADTGVGETDTGVGEADTCGEVALVGRLAQVWKAVTGVVD